MIRSRKLAEGSTHKVSTGLTRDPYAVNVAHGMIELLAILFVPALHRATAMGNLAMRRRDPLHGGGVERKEIVSPDVLVLASTVRDARRRIEGRHDLARMDRTLEDRAPDEDRRLPIRVVRDRRTSLGGEWGGVAERYAEARGRGLVATWCGRGPARGRMYAGRRAWDRQLLLLASPDMRERCGRYGYGV